MKPVVQSRIGERGTCFRACLASILELPERAVPDISGSGDKWINETNDFLERYGLRYQRIPYSESFKPDGWGTIEGISPRGGLHACVAHNGMLIHDPHPLDGTGRGLVEVRYYGLLRTTGDDE